MTKDARPLDLLLVNARVYTMDANARMAGAIAVRNGRVAWLGDSARAAPLARRAARVVDCGGGAVVPGFHDAHMHLLAYAAALDAVDCRPSAAPSIACIQRAIARRAADTPRGEWVRAWGYDHAALTERRHPTRWDLDAAAPHHPIRLDHRSGHACALNSLGMERVGISERTPEPRGATIARHIPSGVPNGLLFEMDDFLDGKIPSPPIERLAESVERAARRLLSFGVTSIQDAGRANDARRWRLMAELRRRASPLPRVTLFPGERGAREFADAGTGFGYVHSEFDAESHAWLRLGHAKLMLTASSGRLAPSRAELRDAVSERVETGFPVAIHAVEADAVRAAAAAIRKHPPPDGLPRHRIEHCSECPPDALELVAQSGAAVVTQPAFVHSEGDRYLRDVDAETRPYLYRAASLSARGVPMAFGSDAPIADPSPMRALGAAIARRTASGATLGANEAVDVRAALSAYTIGAARATGIGGWAGSLTPGSAADMAVFERDIFALGADAIAGGRPVVTMLGGRVGWEG